MSCSHPYPLVSYSPTPHGYFLNFLGIFQNFRNQIKDIGKDCLIFFCCLLHKSQHPINTASCSYLFIHLFVWLHRAACEILVPRPGIEPMPPAVEGRSLNHWTTREGPPVLFELSQYLGEDSTAWISHNSFSWSPVDRHLGFSPSFAITSDTQ